MASMLIAWSLAAWLTMGAQPAAPQVSAAAPVSLSAPLEQEAKKLERMLIAPCCWMQPVADHASAASDEVKRQIREWLGQGMTEQQILDAFVQQYGPRILAEPPNTGVGRYLYVAPWLVLGLSGIGLVVLVKRFTATRVAAAPATVASGGPAAAPTTSPTDPDRADQERLDDELRELD